MPILAKNLKVISLILLSLIIANHAKASDISPPVVDIYKTTQITASDVTKRFSKQLMAIQTAELSPGGAGSTENNKKFLMAMQQTIAGIKKMGHFAYVNVAPIMYPGQKNIFITIDIVDENDRQRLALFNPEPTQSLPDPDHLIAEWQAYEKAGFEMMIREKKAPLFQACPAYHCIFGFDYPALHPYQAIFVEKVPADKSQLVNILQNDKEARKRGSAAFLLAHIKNGQELINILTPAMFDPDEGVRNNVIRVLGMTIEKMHNPDFPIEKVTTALNFPSATDRNKSLFVISGLIKQPRYAKYIREHAGQQLLDNLKMSQPNVHDFAYQILLTLSGKKFGERDYQAWQQWLESNRS